MGEFAIACLERVCAALARAEARSKDGIASFAAGLRIARKLARELQAEGVLDSRGRARSEVEGCCGLVPAGESEDGAVEGTHGEGCGAGSGPGEMEIVSAPMPVRLRSGPGAGRRWRAASEGSVVRYVGRWPTDRAIFRKRQRGRGGASVLVDTSGSMSIEVDDLDGLLLATPAGARVAI